MNQPVLDELPYCQFEVNLGQLLVGLTVGPCHDSLYLRPGGSARVEGACIHNGADVGHVLDGPHVRYPHGPQVFYER